MSFKRHICCFNFLSVFLDLIPILFFLVLISILFYIVLTTLNDTISRLNEIFFVLISVLISLFQFLF